MLRLICPLLLGLSVAAASSPLCEQYVECLAKTRAKAAECAALEDGFLHGKGAPECEEARAEHQKMTDLLGEKNAAYDSCISQKAATVEELSGKKKEKCDKVSAAVATSSTTPSTRVAEGAEAAEGGRKERALKQKKEAKAEHKKCLRESRTMRARCVALSKCCAAVKQCSNNGEFKEKILSLRKTLKQKSRQCKQASHRKSAKPKAKLLKEKKAKESKEKREKAKKVQQETKNGATAAPSE